MPIRVDDLKSKRVDYYRAHRENGELVMEPTCACGNALEEDYYCHVCRRECDCTFIACEDVEILLTVEKLIRGNPNFRNFQAQILDR